MSAKLHPFFDEDSDTFSYIVADENTGACAIIDAVKRFDYISGRTDTACADQIIDCVACHGYHLDWILETHIHADHLSAAPYIKEKLGGKIGIGEKITDVQTIFKKIFNAEDGFKADGRQFDHLFKDEEVFPIGGLAARVMHTPGHTPACISYLIDDMVFVGDTIFMPDVGAARADFPGGDAHALYRSIKKLLALPEQTKIMLCHDYPPDGRKAHFRTTVLEQRQRNIHINDSLSEEEFVRLRKERDLTLELPTLMIPSVQINMRGGRLPPVERNGVRYIKVPLDLL